MNNVSYIKRKPKKKRKYYKYPTKLLYNIITGEITINPKYYESKTN